MTRRDFTQFTVLSASARRPLETPLVVPVNRISDRRAQCKSEEYRRFWSNIWPEAIRDFGQCGIQLQCTDTPGEVRRSPAGRPIFDGLRRGVINLVLTDYIPMHWDNGRALAGVTTLQEGCCICLIALRYAHANRIPFLSTNTCVHEMLHALMQDVFLRRPSWLQVGERESRIDWYATRMWLFGSGVDIRRSASMCIKRLQSPLPSTI
jgi:hypothetical protein